MKTMNMTVEEIQKQYNSLMRGHTSSAGPEYNAKDNQGQFRRVTILRQGKVTYSTASQSSAEG